MKQITHILLAIVISSGSLQATTYEQIRAEVAHEADHLEQKAIASFSKEYKPAICKLGLSAALTGLLIPIIYQKVRQNQTIMACFYSALATASGFFSLLQFAELMEDRRVMNDKIARADRMYHDKMDHIHTRHYMNDIAKFMMTGFEDLAEKYFSTQIMDSYQ